MCIELKYEEAREEGKVLAFPWFLRLYQALCSTCVQPFDAGMIWIVLYQVQTYLRTSSLICRIQRPKNHVTKVRTFVLGYIHSYPGLLQHRGHRLDSPVF